MARIAIVVFAEVAKDPRVRRHIEALSTQHQVTTIGFGKKPDGATNHIEIPANKSYLPTRPDLILATLLRRFEYVLRKTPALRYVRDVLKQYHFELVLTNDTMPIAPALSSDLRVIADLHEFSPKEMEDDWRFRVFLQKLYMYICQTRLGRCSLVTTVSEGLANAYMESFGVRTEVIWNVRKSVSQSEKKFPKSNSIRLVHTGLASKSRRLENIARAVNGLAGFSLDLYLVEAPFQRRYFRNLKREIASMENVQVIEPVPPDQLIDTISKYHAGLIVIFPSNFSLEHAMPNKLFDCAIAGRGLIVGPNKDMSKFVLQNNLGLVTSGFDPSSIRTAISELTINQLWEFSENAQRFSKRFNGDEEAVKLVGLVNEVLEKSKKCQ